MNVDQLKAINGQIKSGKKVLSKRTIDQVSEKLRFSPEHDPLFLNEVNIFVHAVHKALHKADYYDQIESDLDEICTLSRYIAGNLKVLERQSKPLSKSMNADVIRMGKILAKIAPFIRLVSGVIILLNNSDVKFG